MEETVAPTPVAVKVKSGAEGMDSDLGPAAAGLHDVGTVDDDDAGTPDLPLPEARSQPVDDGDRAGGADVASALEDEARRAATPPVPPPTASNEPRPKSLADVLGKRATPVAPVAAGKTKSAKARKSNVATGPGIASFFGGGARAEPSDTARDPSAVPHPDPNPTPTDAPTREPDPAEPARLRARPVKMTKAQRFAAAEAEEAAAIAAAIAASEAEEEERMRRAAATVADHPAEPRERSDADADAEAEAEVEADDEVEGKPVSEPLSEPASVDEAEESPKAETSDPPSAVSVEEAKKVHPLLLAAKRRAAAAAEAEREKAEKAATAAAEAEREKAAAAAAEREEAPAPASSPPAVASPEEDGACRVCGVDDDEGLLCDGCNACYHAKCLGLDTVPDGDWYCEACLEGVEGFPDSNPTPETAAPPSKPAAPNPFFMKPEERKRLAAEKAEAAAAAAAASAREALKAEMREQKARDAAHAAGKKTHHFFAMQREKAAAVKAAGGAQAAAAAGLAFGVVEPKPAPIERAMPPVHVARASATTPDETKARAALAGRMGPPRAIPPAAAEGFAAAPLLESSTGAAEKATAGAEMKAAERGFSPSTTATPEEAEDAMLTNVAKFVLASRGRWNVAAVVSGELVAVRGKLRHQLFEIKRRGAAAAAAASRSASGASGASSPSSSSPSASGSSVRIPPAASERGSAGPAARAGALWVDAYKPASTEDAVGDRAAARGFHDWLRAWQTQIATEAAGTASASGTSSRRPPKKRPRRRDGSRDGDGDSEDGDDSEDDVDDDALAARRYVPAVDRRGVPATGMLLTGPVGSGKTATVYAAARELGFDVLEVNPSRKRSGMDILARFGEATQSRRLAGGAGAGGAEAEAGESRVCSGRRRARIRRRRRRAGRNARRRNATRLLRRAAKTP